MQTFVHGAHKDQHHRMLLQACPLHSVPSTGKVGLNAKTLMRLTYCASCRVCRSQVEHFDGMCFATGADPPNWHGSRLLERKHQVCKHGPAGQQHCYYRYTDEPVLRSCLDMEIALTCRCLAAPLPCTSLYAGKRHGATPEDI